uniref:Uncharacterized protein n=1 Tax=Aegilops tauschii subsp. strangulata TaxID=200361 RepID=A0A453N053_AEGTS
MHQLVGEMGGLCAVNKTQLFIIDENLGVSRVSPYMATASFVIYRARPYRTCLTPLQRRIACLNLFSSFHFLLKGKRSSLHSGHGQPFSPPLS